MKTMDKGQEVSILMSNSPTALYGADASGMRSAERRKVNVLEMKCLRSLLECHEWIELGMRRCV